MELNDLFMEHTPVETYEVKGRKVFVKRDDLYGIYPNAGLSKARGILEHIRKKMKEGYNTFGVYDTRVSTVGLGTSIICKYLGVRCIIFFPQKKGEYASPNQLVAAGKFGAILHPVKATHTKISYNFANLAMQEYGDKAYLIPLACILPETIVNVRKEAETIPEECINNGTLVICVGSGTIASGVLLALTKFNYKAYGVCVGIKSNEIEQRIEKHFLANGEFIYPNIELVESSYDYYEKCTYPVPFPSHKNYDAKAYEWLVMHIDELKEPILFYNIGSDYEVK